MFHLARRAPYLLMFFSVAVFLVIGGKPFLHPDWVPVRDTLTQYTEFLYALSSFQRGELPLWNSYLYGGQPFYLYLNHGLLLTPVAWIWIALGTVVHLDPPRIFAAYHLSEVLLLAFGGFAFVRQLTRSRYAGAICFLVLLFSGEATFWKVQVYPLAVIAFVPWSLFFILRYIRNQTAKNALAVAIVLGIAGNSYYPSYVAAFFATLGICLLVFYSRTVRHYVNLPAAGKHALLALPLFCALLLPTYLIYRDITANYYQVSRYSDVRQEEQGGRSNLPAMPPTGPQYTASVKSIMRIEQSGYREALPFVGVGAVLLALIEVLSFSRRSLFWLAMTCFMFLHYLGNTTPFFSIAGKLIPYYGIIRSPSFFSGYVILCLAIMSSLGALRLLAMIRAVQIPRYDKLTVPFTGSALLLFLVLGKAGWITSTIGLIGIAVIVVIARYGSNTAYSVPPIAAAALMSLLVVMGGYHQWLLETNPLVKVEYPMFSYTNLFSFDFIRPREFTVVQPLEAGGECCSTNYHMAEKIDGPYYFGLWGSPHTLFVSKEYYHAAAPGVDALMQRKLWLFSGCSAVGRIDDYRPYLGSAILPVPSQGSGGGAGCLGGAQGAPLVPADLAAGQYNLLYKTANDVAFTVSAERPLYLLYTDTYHDGFIARVDGESVALIKGMGFLKAVRLKPGKHIVEFLFRPRYRFVLVAYLCVTGMFILSLACYVVLDTIRNAYR